MQECGEAMGQFIVTPTEPLQSPESKKPNLVSWAKRLICCGVVAGCE